MDMRACSNIGFPSEYIPVLHVLKQNFGSQSLASCVRFFWNTHDRNIHILCKPNNFKFLEVKATVWVSVVNQKVSNNATTYQQRGNDSKLQ